MTSLIHAHDHLPYATRVTYHFNDIIDRQCLGLRVRHHRYQMYSFTITDVWQQRASDIYMAKGNTSAMVSPTGVCVLLMREQRTRRRTNETRSLNRRVSPRAKMIIFVALLFDRRQALADERKPQQVRINRITGAVLTRVRTR